MANDRDFFPTRQPQNALVMGADPSAVAAAESAKAIIQAAFIMALQKPRNEMQSRDRILMACKRSEFAGKAEYRKPVGGKKSVTGPSIRFAELALREWGNIRSDVQTLYDDDNIRRCRISIIDLETNAQFNKDIQLKKTVERKSKQGREDDVISERKNSYNETVYILRATDEEMYTKEAAWVSRVLRNEGLRLIPTDIIEEGMQTARATIANRAHQDPEGEKKKVMDAFSSIGVRPKDLEKYLGHSISSVSPKEIIDLRSVYQSIRDGESAWSDYLAMKDRPDDGDIDELVEQFNLSVVGLKQINQFLAPLAKGSNMTIDQVKAEIMRSDDLGRCIENYKTWERVNGQRESDQSDGGAVGAGTDAVSKAQEIADSLNNGTGELGPRSSQNETAGRQDLGPEKNQAVSTPPTVEEARKWCVENHTLGRYFEDKRLLVETAAASLNIDMKGKLPRQIHQEIINALSKGDEKADEPPPPDNGEFLDGLNYFNEAVAESKMVQGGSDVLRQAVDAAGLKAGQRPVTLEQCQKFREVYSKLMADHKVGSGMDADTQESEATQEVDPEKVWDQLYDLVHQNHPGTNFQLLKSYMKQVAEREEVAIELVAQKYIDDDQFESEFMAGFARWRNGDFDKGF